MKMYVMKSMMDNLIRDKILLADPVTFTGIFEKDVFEINLKNVTKAYETHLLKKADIDERIFLGNYYLY